MDVSSLIQAEASKYKSITVEKGVPLEIDVGLLAVTDLNPIDAEAYNSDRDTYLQDTARDGIQLLLSQLFSLPTQSSADGPLALLPPPTTTLPRAKPLPKPKVPTKWERFAAAKGIQKKVKEKKVWDDDKGEWVERWGRNGKNKEVEEQWIHELPDNADDDFDPVREARTARKSRVSKNEEQRLKNLATTKTKGDERAEKKTDLERSLAVTRGSTASMGKFDKKLDGEPKLRGVKRKFEPTEKSLDSEKQTSLAILSKLDGSGGTKKARKDVNGGADEEVLNVRKAVRFASKGRGALALGREVKDREAGGGGRSGRGRGGSRGSSRGSNRARGSNSGRGRGRAKR